MIIKNLTRRTIVTKDLKLADSFQDRVFGLINTKNPRSLLIKTRFGVHTLFLKDTIDVLVLDNKVEVRKATSVKPYHFLICNPRYYFVVELPEGSIKKSKTKVGDKLEMLKSPHETKSRR